MKKNLLLFICAFVAQLAFAQAQAVKGTVLDSSGEPVIGATVKVLGTKQATVTDIDGNFTIQEVNPNASINISYVGMQPVTLKASGNLNVTLKDDFQNLNDVVVVLQRPRILPLLSPWLRQPTSSLFLQHRL